MHVVNFRVAKELEKMGSFSQKGGIDIVYRVVSRKRDNILDMFVLLELQLSWKDEA